MKVVHYSLGLFPHRTGGLNRYATDLMREESKVHDVALLYPSGYRWWEKNCFISKSQIKDSIMCYRLMNAEPVPLLFGIKKAKNFYGQRISESSFERFYTDFEPDVLHLHTLMGLPEAALLFFKKKGVRIVYTSHDYFGICPKVNLINDKGELCDGPNPNRCALCNAEAPSTLYLRLRNSTLALKTRDLARWLKNMINF